FARDADDHRPRTVVVRRGTVVAERRIYIQREAVVGILGHPVKTGIPLAARLRRREIARREEVLPRCKTDQPLLYLFEALARHAVGALDGAHLRSEEHTSELQSRGHLVCR